MEKPTESEELTPADVRQIYMDVSNGTAKASDVKRVLDVFCHPEGKDGRAYQEALKFLQRRLSAFIRDEVPIENALGLVRKKGRPEADEEKRSEMATSVLKRRLAGESHQDALATVSESFHCGETCVGDAWRVYKMDAVFMLRMERANGSTPWSDQEIKRFCEIFKDEKWFVPPGESPTVGPDAPDANPLTT